MTKPRWTKDELSLLKSIYHTMNAQELVKIFNRSVFSIRQQAQRIGIASHKPINDGLTKSQRFYKKHKKSLNKKQRTEKKQRYGEDPNYREGMKTKAMVYHWTETHRAELLKKYGKKCARCGYSEFESALCVHHINGRQDSQNLVLLCMNCHKALHSKLWKMEELPLQNL